MGLCKCPKKKVTNQFCFEHCVNVCEYCMVSNHKKCIVQSYLQWLQDSDYDPNCKLCKTELAVGECIRLICYHVFHWECFDKYASQLPPHTAPAGYTCPLCNKGIFPASNMVSPVAEAFRNALLGVNWARSGLGFPLIPENSVSELAHNDVSTNSSPKKSAAEPSTSTTVVNSHYGNPSCTHKVNSSTSSSSANRPEPYGAPFSAGHFSAPRKIYDATEHGPFRANVFDHDEDKYKRRSASEWFARWFKSKNILGGNRRRDPSVFYKRWVVIGMLALIALCTITIIFIRVGRASANADPLLDPHFNPNIRVHDSIENAGYVVDKKNVDQLPKNVEEILPG